MTIHEMHIGLDLILQRINSNVFNKLLKEEKDWFINVTTQELVRAVLLEENNTVFNIVAYTDIRKYYEALQYYIRSTELSVNTNSGERFSYGDFPMNVTMGNVSSGGLYRDIYYKIITLGDASSNLGNYGTGANPNTGDIFLCSPSVIYTNSNFDYIKGEIYRIENAGGINAVSFGASSNIPGTVFTCTSSGTTTGGANSAALFTKLYGIPTWSGGTVLTPISNYGYFNYLSSRTAVKYGQSISSYPLVVGKKYIVTAKSSTCNFYPNGGNYNCDVGFIFRCTAATPLGAWPTSAILYEVTEPQNRIVKAQDIYNILDYSFGTTNSSPIAILSDNKVKVYHDRKFEALRIYLDYIKEPITVSKENNVSSDLPVSLHSTLVNLTADYINRAMGSVQQPTENRQ